MDGKLYGKDHSRGSCSLPRASLNVISEDERVDGVKEEDHLLPIANVGRIMKQVLPPNAKISKQAKETMQECASEFVSFITGEASDRCRKEKRKTINGDDICYAMKSLGLDEYAETMGRYLHKYRENEEILATSMKQNKAIQIDVRDELSIFRKDRHTKQQPLASSLDVKDPANTQKFL
ncbi:nuclear transcription factor Y subunit B-4-like [Typha latifolia]|uniref:nuclear transcription factor Y subunit B-4-like n=1 Tax=Typha latifolia TaxID=4733 RepID=UPI003C2C9FE5